MKTKLFFAILLSASSLSLQAQWGPNGTHIFNNNTGNVGISNGSSFTPLEKLHLTNGNFLMDYVNGGMSGNLYIGGKTNGAPTGENGLRFFYLNSGTRSAYFDVRTPDAAGGFIFRADGTLGGTERMRIQSNGNVGIGTSTPASRFHVHGGYIKVSGTNPFGGPMVVLGNSPNGDWGIEYTTSGVAGLNFWKPSLSSNPGNNYLFITDDGKVGIGTNAPGSFKLAVEGKIGCRELKVTLASPWPDYVFDDNYVLKPLEEVEQYIDLNKHLPGMPSSNELITNEGIDVGNMQTLQMEKIEELYLYTIELNKRMETLERENQELKSQLTIQK